MQTPGSSVSVLEDGDSSLKGQCRAEKGADVHKCLSSSSLCFLYMTCEKCFALLRSVFVCHVK